MATIEMNIERYNSMLEHINNLEKDVDTLKKENIALAEKLEDSNDNIELLRNVNWYDRVFGWKQILKLTKSEKAHESEK